MSPSRFTPEQMRENAEALEYVLNECESDDETIDEAAAMLRQSASDAEALADLQRKVKELRQEIRERIRDCASMQRQTAYAKVLSHMNALGLTPSPEQGASK